MSKHTAPAARSTAPAAAPRPPYVTREPAESTSPHRLYGRLFPKVLRDRIVEQARKFGAASAREELVGNEFLVLCCLEQIATRMVRIAETAKSAGMSHETAYQEFHTFVKEVLDGSRDMREPRPSEMSTEAQPSNDLAALAEDAAVAATKAPPAAEGEAQAA